MKWIFLSQNRFEFVQAILNNSKIVLFAVDNKNGSMSQVNHISIHYSLSHFGFLISVYGGEKKGYLWRHRLHATPTQHTIALN